MLPFLDKVSAPIAGLSDEPPAGDAISRLNIAVVFTSIESTLSALRTAGTLASRLNAHVTLIVPEIVPYPLPLTRPPVQLEFNQRRFRVLAGHCRVETTVRIYLCRDRDATLKAVLKPRSLVVIGGAIGWRPTPERRLARNLRRAGHEVVLTET